MSSTEPGRLFWHVGIVVTELESAMDELTRAVGLHWNPIRERQLGDSELRVSFSVEGPPFLELIEGQPGSPWDTSNGPHLDHLGFLSANLAHDRARMQSEGFELAIDGEQLSGPWVVHDTRHTGARIEQLDESARPHLERILGTSLTRGAVAESDDVLG